MKIFVINQQKDLQISALSAKSIIKEVLATEQFETDEITIHFVTNEEMCRLHFDFFNDPSPTDCISFPLDNREERTSGYHVLGEIFVCPWSALQFIEEKKLAYQETTLYLVHSLLHLLGYDDLETKELKKMRQAEKRHMNHLLQKSPPDRKSLDSCIIRFLQKIFF